jgi:DNA-binding transcriptional MocR family regulator
MLVVSQLADPHFDGRGRAEQIEKQLESAIRVGLLTSGDRLPPSRFSRSNWACLHSRCVSRLPLFEAGGWSKLAAAEVVVVM